MYYYASVNYFHKEIYDIIQFAVNMPVMHYTD